MSQEDIINLLEEVDKSLSRTEIANELDESPVKVSMLLNKLLKYNEILFEEIDRELAIQKYNCKRRMRLYKSKRKKKPKYKKKVKD